MAISPLSTENTPKSAAFNESEYYSIYINPIDIIMGDKVLSVGGSVVDCTVNISYPIANSSWKFIFPDTYSDVSGYYIRRGATAYYYAEEDATVTNPIFTGSTTHWKISASAGMVDTLHFTLLLPTVASRPDVANTDYDKITNIYSIGRLDPATRPYSDLTFSGSTVLGFPDFTFEMYNITGIVAEEDIGDPIPASALTSATNVTAIADLTYYYRDTASGRTLYFSVNFGDIRNKTFYAFVIVITAKVTQSSFFSNWLINIVAPFLGFFFAGLGLAPIIWQYAFKDVRRGQWRTREYIRRGIPFGVLVGIAGFFIFYLMSLF